MKYTNDYKREIMRRMSQGMKQSEIADSFKKEGVEPSSPSSIEKAIKDARKDLKAKNNVHLVAKAMRMNLIK